MTQFETMVLRRLAKIESLVAPAQTEWISEEEAMQLTGLKKTALYEKRKAGVFNWSSATGRKIKYLRRDVMAYLNGNSTLINNNLTVIK